MIPGGSRQAINMEDFPAKGDHEVIASTEKNNMNRVDKQYIKKAGWL